MLRGRGVRRTECWEDGVLRGQGFWTMERSGWAWLGVYVLWY